MQIIEKAEEIAYQNGYKGISIISGIGVREYYQKKGYHLENNNMVKLFTNKSTNLYQRIYLIVLLLIIIQIIFLLL